MTTLKTAVQFLGNENPYVSGKAATELGWRPVVAAAEAAERTARWFADHT
jgi:nucleoside-diphosphate-sugar epimerase